MPSIDKIINIISSVNNKVFVVEAQRIGNVENDPFKIISPDGVTGISHLAAGIDKCRQWCVHDPSPNINRLNPNWRTASGVVAFTPLLWPENPQPERR